LVHVQIRSSKSAIAEPFQKLFFLKCDLKGKAEASFMVTFSEGGIHVLGCLFQKKSAAGSPDRRPMLDPATVHVSITPEPAVSPSEAAAAAGETTERLSPRAAEAGVIETAF
jgi:hypothetical protein